MLVSPMANQLDSIFAALSDPTRRAVIARLGQGEAAVKTLAEPHDMALPSFLKHIDTLERAGLVRSRKDGRVRVCTLHPEALAVVETWIDQQKRLWEGRLDRLSALAEQIASDGKDIQ
ncbi:metalloregulator ArsR/SmtB family transcription factor [Rhodobacterales bacterium HKCCE4037]|nr:metalloregulator ArsR/SmtB family transcription factor [Rhodobacterales bacterium HKCCE4037]